MRAPDWWESARFQAVCVTWSWFRQNGVISSRPPAGNAHRWAATHSSFIRAEPCETIESRRKTTAGLDFIIFHGDHYGPTHAMGFAHRPMDANLPHSGARYVFSSRQLSRRRKLLHSLFSHYLLVPEQKNRLASRGSIPLFRVCKCFFQEPVCCPTSSSS